MSGDIGALQATVENVVQSFKRQCGKTIWALLMLKGFDVLREISDNPEEILPRWARTFGELPPAHDHYWMTLENTYQVVPFSSDNLEFCQLL